MADREKLIELLNEVQDNGHKQGDHVLHYTIVSNEKVADHLIANGVTFATGTNVGDKGGDENA